ncbi:MAG: TIGR04222 domain-containing membrane protein [Xenococcaceae cyanobacterium]
MVNILFYNPISRMYGPYFLVFYGVVIGVVVLVIDRARQEATDKLPALNIGDRPDPYQIAYMIAGEKEILKLVCFGLIQRGYLEVNRHLIKQVTNHPDVSTLNELETKLFAWFRDSHTGEEMIDEFNLIAELTDKYAEYKQWLENEQLIFSQQTKEKACKMSAIGSFIIIALGAYKLISALLREHHNVLFLILMAILGTGWLLVTCQKYHRRLTKRGQNYLDRLQQVFKNLKGELQTPPTQVDYNTLLLISIFGLKILVKTPYENYLQLFTNTTQSTTSSQRRSSSSSSCGSSCGGGCSSSCGSSCGGGCGGCGS